MVVGVAEPHEKVKTALIIAVTNIIIPFRCTAVSFALLGPIGTLADSNRVFFDWLVVEVKHQTSPGLLDADGTSIGVRMKVLLAAKLVESALGGFCFVK